jgi:hypothetical protein
MATVIGVLPDPVPMNVYTKREADAPPLAEAAAALHIRG